MIILEKNITIKSLPNIEDKMYFNDIEMIKAVVDIDKEVIAVNAELHSDLEQLLLDNGSIQENLYGYNIYFDGEIEYDSLINPPRNRDDGFPRGGRDVCDPIKRKKIEEITRKWIQ